MKQPRVTQRRRVLILGAAGRDFHDFNLLYRDDPASEVIAFTATQIPDIAGRRYPAVLAGPHYPDGIPILPEAELDTVLATQRIDEVVFAYSDVPHAHVMALASRVLAAGADFLLPGPGRTMLEATVPVVAVSAVRTGCGKSQVARWLARRARTRGLRVAVIRHPMPYGDLARQAVQRFATPADLDAAACTVEEREEYEPHLATGTVVFAGVDYAAILARAAAEADLIVWDGGNNDFPFVRPAWHVVLVDPLRAGDEATHHPGTAVLGMADVVLVAKANVAAAPALDAVRASVARLNPRARVLRGASPVTLDDTARVRGAQVLVVEDGPTLTHGGMAYGAGQVAALAAGAAVLVDPRVHAHADIRAVYAAYPHIGKVLPAVGYGPRQLAALAATIEASEADVVVAATPCDLARLVRLTKPVVRARYEYAELEEPGLGAAFDAFLVAHGLSGADGPT